MQSFSCSHRRPPSSHPVPSLICAHHQSSNLVVEGRSANDQVKALDNTSLIELAIFTTIIGALLAMFLER